jgi:hypothetical protein
MGVWGLVGGSMSGWAWGWMCGLCAKYRGTEDEICRIEVCV